MLYFHKISKMSYSLYELLKIMLSALKKNMYGKTVPEENSLLKMYYMKVYS